MLRKLPIWQISLFSFYHLIIAEVRIEQAIHFCTKTIWEENYQYQKGNYWISLHQWLILKIRTPQSFRNFRKLISGVSLISE